MYGGSSIGPHTHHCWDSYKSDWCCIYSLVRLRFLVAIFARWGWWCYLASSVQCSCSQSVMTIIHLFLWAPIQNKSTCFVCHVLVLALLFVYLFTSLVFLLVLLFICFCELRSKIKLLVYTCMDLFSMAHIEEFVLLHVGKILSYCMSDFPYMFSVITFVPLKWNRILLKI